MSDVKTSVLPSGFKITADNRPMSFIAWSTAIQSALTSGGTMRSIATSAANIGVGMRLSAQEIDADRTLFDWDAIAERLTAHIE